MTATSRPFQLMIDAASSDEPPARHFGSLENAVKALEEVEEKWLPFAQILEKTEVGLNIVHYRNGVPVRPA